MSAGVQLTGIVQPSPQMIQDENYEVGDIILPRREGKWTLFGVQPIFTKDDETLPITREYNAGHPAATACQVTWLAADQVAFGITIERYMKEQQALQRQQAVTAAGPKIVLPGLG